MSEELAGIVQVSCGKECHAGQEVEGNGGVLKKICINKVGMDLEEVGLLGACFYERKQLFLSLGLSF